MTNLIRSIVEVVRVVDTAHNAGTIAEVRVAELNCTLMKVVQMVHKSRGLGSPEIQIVVGKQLGRGTSKLSARNCHMS